MELPFDRAALIAGCKAAVKENDLADCYLESLWLDHIERCEYERAHDAWTLRPI